MTSSAEPLRVLLVEDDEDDYLITRDLLSEQDRVRFVVDWCSEYDDALATMGEQRHDVYLVDVRLGARTGLELVREAFATLPRAPVLVLTGVSDYQIDLEATALGVTDYLVKQELDALGLERSIRYAVSHHRALDELRRSQERYSLAVRAANDGLWDWDLVGGELYLSPRWHAILGRPEQLEAPTPQTWFALVHPDDSVRLHAAIDAHLEGGTPHFEAEHRMRHADGGWRWTLSRGVAIRDADGRATRMAGSLSDITERRRAERQLQHDALHDGLTGLPNRALFMDRVAHVLQRSERDTSLRGAVLFVDIDRFKLVNDSLGHPVGDELLVAVASRVAALLRPADTVARIGGDEFTILLEDLADDSAAEVAASRVERAMAQPFTLGGRDLTVTASIGVAVTRTDVTAAELLRNADIAMYDAKRRGGGRCQVFDERMHRSRVDRLSRERDLRQAVEHGLLEVFYQPIIDLASGDIHSLEALARWPRDWPAVTPLEFIPIAEETGLIGELGHYVLRTALGALARLRRLGAIGDGVAMNVNISSRQLDDPDFAERVLETIAATGVPASALNLEITESALMREPERLHEVVRVLCGAGVGLQLDDFGTGWSSLTALQQFPVSALKIDRSFVASLAGGSDVIVRSTVALAHSLEIAVIAEGIEDAGQLAHLRALGCEYGQGYLFSRPVDAEATRGLLSSWERRAPTLGELPVSA